MRRAVPALAALASLLAGCAGPTEPSGNATTTSTPTPPAATPPAENVSDAEVRAVFLRLNDPPPARVGVRLTGTNLRGTGYESPTTVAYDAATEELLVHFAPWPPEGLVPPENVTSLSGTAAMLSHQGYAYYESPLGRAYVPDGRPDRVFAPAENVTENEGNGTLRDLRRMVSPPPVEEAAIENLSHLNATATTYRGRPAIDLAASFETPAGNASSRIVVYRDPARIALTSAEYPVFGGRRTLTMEYAYDDEVTLDVPLAAKRAITLSHDGGGYAEGPEDATPQTWTFRGGPERVLLSEVEARVVDHDPRHKAARILDEPVLWSMRLDQGSGSYGNVTVTFTDADDDGAVTRGDTLAVDGVKAGYEGPQVVLFDLKTQTAVVSAPGALAVAGVAALAALAWRARR